MRVVPICVTIDTMLNFDISECASVDVDATCEWTKIKVFLGKETTSLPPYIKNICTKFTPNSSETDVGMKLSYIKFSSPIHTCFSKAKYC